ncbi:unnamed protein product, partial [Closterium sp. NIES-54]
ACSPGGAKVSGSNPSVRTSGIPVRGGVRGPLKGLGFESQCMHMRVRLGGYGRTLTRYLTSPFIPMTKECISSNNPTRLNDLSMNASDDAVLHMVYPFDDLQANYLCLCPLLFFNTPGGGLNFLQQPQEPGHGRPR